MNDPDRSPVKLSDHLRRLERHQDHLPPAPFDLDDVVRGGRRRHRRRVALQSAAAAAAVIAVVSVIQPFGGSSGRHGPDVPAGQPGVAASATAPALPPVDAADGRLRYTQQGRTVTASLNGTTVATVALASWSWSGNSGSVLLTVTAARPLTLAPDGLFVDGADGHNEISPKNLRPIAVATGQQQVRLQFTGQGVPTGLSWVMDGPQDADGDGFVGTWELRAADRTG